MYTCAFLDASSLAAAKPIPVFAPVTMTVLPCNMKLRLESDSQFALNALTISPPQSRAC